MPYPDHPADCPKLEAWREGREYGKRDGDVGSCIECPHQEICVGSEISLMNNVLVDIRSTMKDTPKPIGRLAKALLKVNS